MKAEVERAIKNSQLGKAPGEDGITTEMLKLLEDFGIDKLTELFNAIYETGDFPEDLLMSIFITLPKQARATECSNFRTISLMPHTLKIFLKVIQGRIGAKIDKEVGPTQFGFRPGSGTREGIFCYNIIAQKHLEVDKDLFTCFIDYSKAFDRVHHVQLIQCLEKIGVDGRDIRVIANLYWHQKAAIRIQNELSPFTSIQRGVRQGCVLSPYLFNIYTEFIFRECNDLQGINIHGLNINNLRYADDTALCAESHEEIVMLLNNINEEGKKKNMKLNAKKTKVMHIGKGQYVDIDIDGETLEKVLEFVYLGSCKTADGDCKPDIMRRIARAKAKMIELENIWRDRDLSKALKIRIMKVLVWTTVNYGAEGWTLRAEEKKKNPICRNVVLSKTTQYKLEK